MKNIIGNKSLSIAAIACPKLSVPLDIINKGIVKLQITLSINCFKKIFIFIPP